MTLNIEMTQPAATRLRPQIGAQHRQRRGRLADLEGSDDAGADHQQDHRPAGARVARRRG